MATNKQKAIDRLGEKIESSQCGIMEIVEYNNAHDVKVVFKTGNIVKSTYSDFKRGLIRDHLVKRFLNVGFVGAGKHKTCVRGKKTKAYKKWDSMMSRCYSEHRMRIDLTYINVSVCDTWHNFQNFAEWYSYNYYEIPNEIMHLDKDLTKKNNKVYCPEFCGFVPTCINNILNSNRSANRKYPVGVCYNPQNKNYYSRMRKPGSNPYIGSYNTMEEAFESYKFEKEKQLKVMANKYKNYIPSKIYKYLMEYEVKISD